MNRRRILSGLGLLGAALLALGFYGPFPPSPATLRMAGVVEIQEVGLGPKIAGRVARVLVREGEVVESGQELVVLDAPELETQRRQGQARVRAAEAELAKARNGPRAAEKAAARATVEAARARWQRLSAGPRAEEIRQARGELDGARADLQLAENEFDRAQGLYRRSATSRAEYETARASLDRARGRCAAARARLEQLTNGTRPEDVAEARAELEKAGANYQLLQEGARQEEIAGLEARLAEEQGKLDETEARLAERVIRAPERTLVEVVAVRSGDLVSAQQAVVRVLRAEDLWVKVFVPETELGKIRLNQAVAVTIDAYPGRRFAGTVVQIAAASEFTPRNVQTVDERRFQLFGVKVLVPDAKGIFKAGMAAEVELPLPEEP